MDHETRVTGGATAGVVLGSAVLLVGVDIGNSVLQGVGGALVVLAIFALAAYLAGLDDGEHAH
ncbi:MAG: hypothetical protein ABEH77_10265 [Halobacteriaceae archaeon]